LKKKNSIIIAITISALIIAAAALITINRNSMDLPPSDVALRLIAGGETVRDYTIEEIMELPAVEVDKDIVSASKDDESGTFKGVPLEVLLEDARKGILSEYKEFITRGEDGFVSSVYASDIEKGENVIIVYEKDGEAIKGRDDGGFGPLRVIIVDDDFGNRGTSYLKSIEAK